MGEPIWLKLVIGGALPDKEVSNLCKVLSEDFGFKEKDVETDIRAPKVTNDSFSIENHVNWGNVNESLDLLKKLQLPWMLYEDALGRGEPCVGYWVPGMAASKGTPSTMGGTPLMKFPREALRKGIFKIIATEFDDVRGIDDAIDNLLDSVDETNIPDIPPLQII
jgi:hypothetical protein